MSVQIISTLADKTMLELFVSENDSGWYEKV